MHFENSKGFIPRWELFSIYGTTYYTNSLVLKDCYRLLTRDLKVSPQNMIPFGVRRNSDYGNIFTPAKVMQHHGEVYRSEWNRIFSNSVSAKVYRLRWYRFSFWLGIPSVPFKSCTVHRGDIEFPRCLLVNYIQRFFLCGNETVKLTLLTL